MLFLKKIILGGAAIFFIFLGGSGTQSNSLLAQGTGVVGLIIGLIVLYIFFKMALSAMGCLPSFLIFSAIVVFILYALGMFNDGIGNVGVNINKFLGQATPASTANTDVASAVPEKEGVIETIDEWFDDFNIEPVESELAQTRTTDNGSGQVATPAQENGLVQILNNITGNAHLQPTQEEARAFNPMDYPELIGTPKVVNGDTISIGGKYIKFFGVDAAVANQTCADKNGRSYKCGQEAATWLKSWITDYDVECRIVKRDAKGNMMGVCFLGEYDIGAAIVNAGWAVADTRITDIYLPYQQQAQSNRRGLWQGQFYMPSDWRKLQSAKPKIKVINPKKETSIFDF